MVYLDYNASTPVDERVVPALTEAYKVFGNPASAHHRSGRAAAELIEEARGRVASLFRRPPQDVIFTSGSTEAAAIGVVGAMLGAPGRPNVVVSTTEHKAVLAAADLGARLTGGEVRRARVGASGSVDLDNLNELVDDSVSVVAVMAANNETGVVASSLAISEIVWRCGALNFTDITQLVGKGSIDDAAKTADMMICSSHKIYGPKGAGALIAGRRTQNSITPILGGGGQERGLRGGTQNTVAIVGFGLAAELAEKEKSTDVVRIGQMANGLLADLQSRLPDVTVNGLRAARLSNTLNLRFSGADAEAVMASMPDIWVSSGSACQSASPSQSHVLLAMGLSDVEASESLRISLGRPTTDEQVQLATAAIVDAVARVRELTAEQETQQ